MRSWFPLVIAVICSILACGGDPDPDTPPAPPADEACFDELSYRLTIKDSEDVEIIQLNARDFDPTVRYELPRLKSFVWGISIESERGLSRVDLGLPYSCGTKWTQFAAYPNDIPSITYNTGEPLLIGQRWERPSLSGLATFPDLTVEGEIKTAVLTEYFELLVHVTGPEDAGGEQCVIEHLVPFIVVK